MNQLFLNLLPVLAACLAGWILGRRQDLDIRTLGTIVIYAIAPVVNFDAVLRAPMTGTMLALPIVAFIIGGGNSLLSYALARRCMNEKAHVLFVASSASSANTLYYGLGLALAVLPAEMIAPFCVAAIGLSVSESVFGYYFLARNNFTWRTAVQRVVRLPVLSAVALALLYKITMPTEGLIATIAPLAGYCRGALIILGSMILGVALGQNQQFKFYPRLTATILFTRHMLFAALVGTLLALDAHTAQLIPDTYRTIFLLFALMPIANNSLTFAASLGLPTEAISSTIIFSNAFAIILAAAVVYAGFN
jgi:malate permease and related proteins